MKPYKTTLLLSALICTLSADNATKAKQSIQASQEQIQNIPAQIQNIDQQSHIKKYDMMFEAINTPRQGLNDSNMSNLSDPFLVQKKVIAPMTDGENSSQEELSLRAIFNDRAKINNKWYKKGEKIGDYTLRTIKSSSVMLASKDQNLELNITKRSSNANIKIK